MLFAGGGGLDVLDEGERKVHGLIVHEHYVEPILHNINIKV